MALSGGVGGAKLVVGLAEKIEPGRLLVVANGGDDFEHLGLTICPDADTLLYAGAGLDNPQTGWGRRDETWTFMRRAGRSGRDLPGFSSATAISPCTSCAASACARVSL